MGTRIAVPCLPNLTSNNRRNQAFSKPSLAPYARELTLAKGGDLKSVQEMLGHESLETTQIYLGLAKKVQRRMVQEFAL